MLVDDHTIVRSGFRRLLEEYPNIDVVAEAETGDLAYRGYVEHRPDVALSLLDQQSKWIPTCAGMTAWCESARRQQQPRLPPFL
jgi:DNA-binding NarL/FixJ family response regulator